MKILISALALILWNVAVHAQTNDPNTQTGPTAKTARTKPIEFPSTMPVNYIRVYDMLVPAANDNAINALGNSEVRVMTQYIDGLGRKLQDVSWQATPTGKDMVLNYLYDDYGRISYQYLPAPSTTGDASFKVDAYHQQEDFYGDPTTGYQKDEDIFYSITEFEDSPLNRPVKSMAPGNSWAGSGVGMSTEYLSNISTDDVRKWVISGGVPSSSADYDEGELRVIKVTDEDGQVMFEYKDKLGNVVLKRILIDENTQGLSVHARHLNTYYVYDDRNRLRFVLPPKAVELMEGSWTTWNSTDMNELAFQYTYDGRGRMITKRVPGAGLLEMVYDKLNRVIMSQDANQRVNDEWNFIKYDIFGRVAFTGKYDEVPSLTTRAELQTAADAWTGNLFVIKDITTAGQVTGVSTSYLSHNSATHTYVASEKIEFLPGFNSGTSQFTAYIQPGVGTAIEGYMDNTFPQLPSNPVSQLYTINYYDDYDFTTATLYNGGSNLELAMNIPTATTAVKGLPTGSKVKVLGTSTWLETVMFYDERKRLIQSRTDNYQGGVTINTSELDFAGRALKVFSRVTNPAAAAPDNETRTLKTYTYDAQGRMTEVKMRINNETADKVISSNTYTELGELDVKTLSTNLETLDYDYNIRGWLRGINENSLTGSNTNYFAMGLNYDFGFTDSRLNGNISGMRWRTKSSTSVRHYGFDYDTSNRLTKADYGQTGTGNASDFSLSGLTYDANGNILSLTRKGVIAGTNVTIDNLTYNYMNSGKSNRLQSVDDTEGNLNQGDFKNLNAGSDDYSYDANGNLNSDKNKGIDNSGDIKYNHLNLPEEVKFDGSATKKILYTYDASGIKLRKQVIDGTTTTTTDYIGGIIYENNALQFFPHEEGRVRKDDGALYYDFFVKDHLGNTRLTLTEQTQVTEYRASMEPELAGFEEQVFLNIANTRDTGLTGINTSTELAGNADDHYATLVGNDPNLRIGPGKLLAVTAGDEIDMEVDVVYKSKYLTGTGGTNTDDLVDGIASLFGGLSVTNGGNVEQAAIFDLFDGVDPRNFIDTRALDTDLPRAYLNYIRFDQDFNHIDHDAIQISVNENTHETLILSTSFTGVNAKSGYVYVWLSNESDSGIKVYFDDFLVTHTKGSILQEDHYYPFGMSMAALSSTAPLSKPNNYKYNGFEEETSFDLGWYDYSARQYDPQLGRFTSVDPAADMMRRHSTYNYAFDNPIRYIDPDGMMPDDRVKHGTSGSPFDNRNGDCDKGFGGCDNSEADFIQKDPKYWAGEAGNGGEKGNGGTDPLHDPLKINMTPEYSQTVFHEWSQKLRKYSGHVGTGAKMLSEAYSRATLYSARGAAPMAQSMTTIRFEQTILGRRLMQPFFDMNSVQAGKWASGLKIASRGIGGFGVGLGIYDMSQNGITISNALDTTMSGLLLTGYGTPVAGAYFIVNGVVILVTGEDIGQHTGRAIQNEVNKGIRKGIKKNGFKLPLGGY